jgi:hypothetical protein
LSEFLPDMCGHFQLSKNSSREVVSNIRIVNGVNTLFTKEKHFGWEKVNLLVNYHFIRPCGPNLAPVRYEQPESNGQPKIMQSISPSTFSIAGLLKNDPLLPMANRGTGGTAVSAIENFSVACIRDQIVLKQVGLEIFRIIKNIKTN